VATGKGIEGEGGIDQGDSEAAESIEEHGEEVSEEFQGHPNLKGVTTRGCSMIMPV